ncbi:hypothetical protein GGR56DRAFT_638926 [Xylariaceae sp. FL0804]|nr:hypothetical protein GGR56DRAFT_638926 [Xylariaceae sp. FL0804]
MQPGLYSAAISPPPLGPALRLLLTSVFLFIPFCSSTPVLSVLETEQGLATNYFDSAGVLRNNVHLPAYIGAIAGAYGFSLVLIGVVLLFLARKRRQHFEAADEDRDPYAEFQQRFAIQAGLQQIAGDPAYPQYQYPPQTPKSPIKNFSYPTPPTPSAEKGPSPYTYYPTAHSSSTLGFSPLVDQRVVAADREMAQQQLEEMYRHVMEQEEAKLAGQPYEPPSPVSKQNSPVEPPRQGGNLKKGKNKPSNLNLNQAQPEKQSRTSSILSALKSPRKSKNPKGISISSPIMTPMSGTFPRQEDREMNAIPPRQYAPASPPPIPEHHQQQQFYQRAAAGRPPMSVAPLTPPDDMSPESTMSIDERLRAQQMGGGGGGGHWRSDSQAPTEYEPVSAVSERSTAPLVGLPSSPKPGVSRFPSYPSLPASPKPGATFASPTSPQSQSQPQLQLVGRAPSSSFSRPNAPSAVRTGGALPLRAYEPALTSPSGAQGATTKQTTFERAPLSPGAGMRTPFTGAPVPYTPYQPFSPVVPVTPSLVTKADRKRMRQLAPKTPTVELVKNADEIW